MVSAIHPLPTMLGLMTTSAKLFQWTIYSDTAFFFQHHMIINTQSETLVCSWQCCFICLHSWSSWFVGARGFDRQWSVLPFFFSYTQESCASLYLRRKSRTRLIHAIRVALLDLCCWCSEVSSCVE